MDKLKSRVLTALARQFPDRSFAYDKLTVMHKGRFANAIVFRYCDDGLDLVIKDFSHCPLPVRWTAGRFFIGREAKALGRLGGIKGVAASHYRLSPLMLAYPFIAGQPLRSLTRSGETLPRGFFESLEKMVGQMHRRGVVHLDLRNLGNVLRGDDGQPYFIDFQSSMRFGPFPRWVQTFMRGADLSGVYKAWRALCDEPLPARKGRFFDNFAQVRKRWIFKGYPLTRTANRMKLLSTQLASGELLRNFLERFF